MGEARECLEYFARLMSYIGEIDGLASFGNEEVIKGMVSTINLAISTVDDLQKSEAISEATAETLKDYLRRIRAFAKAGEFDEICRDLEDYVYDTIFAEVINELIERLSNTLAPKSS